MLAVDPPVWKRNLQDRFPDYEGLLDRWQIIRYTAPSAAAIDVGVAKAGTGAPTGDRSQGVTGTVINAMTPETGQGQRSTCATGLGDHARPPEPADQPGRERWPSSGTPQLSYNELLALTERDSEAAAPVPVAVSVTLCAFPSHGTWILPAPLTGKPAAAGNGCPSTEKFTA
jgi:hypothetical protein